VEHPHLVRELLAIDLQLAVDQIGPVVYREGVRRGLQHGELVSQVVRGLNLANDVAVLPRTNVLQVSLNRLSEAILGDVADLGEGRVQGLLRRGRENSAKRSVVGATRHGNANVAGSQSHVSFLLESGRVRAPYRELERRTAGRSAADRRVDRGGLLAPRTRERDRPGPR